MRQGLRNISKLYHCSEGAGQGDVGCHEDAMLVWEKGALIFAGSEKDYHHKHEFGEIEREFDAAGAIVVPGLVDCHTHLCFGGWRSDEFELRMQGASYLEIAKRGGGIRSTLKHTRAATKAELKEKAKSFLSEMVTLGVTTIECKSGYGLSSEDERKTLEAYRELAEEQPLELVSTFLGAHIVPPEFENNRRGYIDLLKNELLPSIFADGLAEYFDVFVEDTAFVLEEARELCEAAKSAGYRLKFHVDQLSSGGGSELAGSLGAVSADHLEYITDSGIAALKAAGTVAVTLPFATLYTRERPLDARKLLEQDVPVAVATDFNPGSAPSFHLPFAMTLACTLNSMTPHEALKGATYYAAKAVNREERIGSLEVGKQADFAVIDAPDVNHWIYHLRANACTATYKAGECLYGELKEIIKEKG